MSVLVPFAISDSELQTLSGPVAVHKAFLRAWDDYGVWVTHLPQSDAIRRISDPEIRKLWAEQSKSFRHSNQAAARGASGPLSAGALAAARDIISVICVRDDDPQRHEPMLMGSAVPELTTIGEFPYCTTYEKARATAKRGRIQKGVNLDDIWKAWFSVAATHLSGTISVVDRWALTQGARGKNGLEEFARRVSASRRKASPSPRTHSAMRPRVDVCLYTSFTNECPLGRQRDWALEIKAALARDNVHVDIYAADIPQHERGPSPDVPHFRWIRMPRIVFTPDHGLALFNHRVTTQEHDMGIRDPSAFQVIEAQLGQTARRITATRSLEHTAPR